MELKPRIQLPVCLQSVLGNSWFSGSRITHLLVLSAVVAAVFGNSLANWFVWDDWGYLLSIDRYRSHDLLQFFLVPGNGVEYLPIRDLSYAIDSALWGGNSFGYHLTNLVLYCLNVFAVYLLAETAASFLCAGDKSERTVHPSLMAFWTALLFAVHPLHSEVVSFITGRNALLSGLFTFLAARCFLVFIGSAGRKSFVNLATALLLFIMALMSKGTSIFLPITLLLCIPLAQPAVRRKGLFAVIPFFLVAIAVFFVFSAIARTNNIIDPVMSQHSAILATRFAIAAQIPYFYLGKLLLPTHLSPDYDVEFAITFSAWPVIGACLGLLFVTAFVLQGRLRHRYAFFAFAWFASSLIPVLHLLPTATTVADRYAYLPSFAAFFLLARVAALIYSRHRGTLLTLAGGALLLCWSLLTIRQNYVWRSDETLWEYTKKVSPRSTKALDNLGNIFFSKGQYAMALDHFRKAQQIDPNDPIYDFFQGFMLFKEGNYLSALDYFERSIMKDGDYIDALFHAGMASEALHEPIAEVYYKRVLSSRSPDVRNFKVQAAMRLDNLAKLSGRTHTE